MAGCGGDCGGKGGDSCACTCKCWCVAISGTVTHDGAAMVGTTVGDVVYSPMAPDFRVNELFELKPADAPGTVSMAAPAEVAAQPLPRPWTPLWFPTPQPPQPEVAIQPPSAGPGQDPRSWRDEILAQVGGAESGAQAASFRRRAAQPFSWAAPRPEPIVVRPEGLPTNAPIPRFAVGDPGATFSASAGAAALPTLRVPSVPTEEALAFLPATRALAPGDALPGMQPSPAPLRPPMAPPHAGSFLLGGAHGGPNSGIRASRAPVAGYDGYPRGGWDGGAAKRPFDSDLDGHRPAMAVRSPAQGREGEVGPLPASQAAPAAPDLARASSATALLDLEDEAPPESFGQAVPALAPRALVPRALPLPVVAGGVRGAVAPPAFVASAPIAEGLRPPAGPFAPGAVPVTPRMSEEHAEGEAVRGPAASPVVAAPTGPSGPSGPVVAAGPAVTPSAVDPVKAFQQQMKASYSTDAGRPPKPEIPGAPAQKGGKGLNIEAMLPMWDAATPLLEEAVALQSQYVEANDLANSLPPGPERDEAERVAKESFFAASTARSQWEDIQKKFAGSLGSTDSLLKRMKEEKERQERRAKSASEKDWKKYDTVPNWVERKQSQSALVGSREARDDANRIQGLAGRLKGAAAKDGPAVKKLAKEAKALAKVAKRAAKDAKNAARFGTKKQASDAAAKAVGAAFDARTKADDAAKALGDAGKPRPEGLSLPPAGGPVTPGSGPPPSTPVPHASAGHAGGSGSACGTCQPKCNVGEVCYCKPVGSPGSGEGGKGKKDGKDDKERKVTEKGSKGKGFPSSAQPEGTSPTGEGPAARPPGSAGETSTEEPTAGGTATGSSDSVPLRSDSPRTFVFAQLLRGGPLKGWLIIKNAATDQLLLLPPQIAEYIRIKDDSKDHEFTGAQYGGARYDMDVFEGLLEDQLRATRGPKYDLNLGDVRAVLDGFAITKEQSEQFISDASWASTKEQALPLLKTVLYSTPVIGQLLAAAETGWNIGRTIDAVRKGEMDLGTALREGASEVLKAVIFARLGKIAGEVIGGQVATGGRVPFQPPLRKRVPRPAPTAVAVRPTRRDYGGAKGPPASQPLDDDARRRAGAGFAMRRSQAPKPEPPPVQPQDGARQSTGGGADGAGRHSTFGKGSRGPYSHLEDHPSAGPGKDFTRSQKRRILSENESRNGGALRDDKTGEPLVRPSKHEKGVRPPDNEAHVDHVTPKSKGGPNTFENAEVRSRAGNLSKGDKMPEMPGDSK
jgi:hypothetical protein